MRFKQKLWQLSFLLNVNNNNGDCMIYNLIYLTTKSSTYIFLSLIYTQHIRTEVKGKFQL